MSTSVPGTLVLATCVPHLVDSPAGAVSRRLRDYPEALRLLRA